MVTNYETKQKIQKKLVKQLLIWNKQKITDIGTSITIKKTCFGDIIYDFDNNIMKKTKK